MILGKIKEKMLNILYFILSYLYVVILKKAEKRSLNAVRRKINNRV
jgi:hypothetical protein